MIWVACQVASWPMMVAAVTYLSAAGGRRQALERDVLPVLRGIGALAHYPGLLYEMEKLRRETARAEVKHRWWGVAGMLGSALLFVVSLGELCWG